MNVNSTDGNLPSPTWNHTTVFNTEGNWLRKSSGTSARVELRPSRWAGDQVSQLYVVVIGWRKPEGFQSAG